MWTDLKLFRLLAAACWLAATSTAAQAVDDHRLEESYLEILRAWTSGDVEAAQALVDFQQAVADGHAKRKVDTAFMVGRRPIAEQRALVPGDACLHHIESHTLEPLFVLDPDTAVPLFVLYLRAYVLATERPERRWVADRLQRKLGRILDGHRVRPDPSPEERRRLRRERSLMLLAQADEMWRQGKIIPDIERSAELFERALALDPQSLAAAYWAGIVHERLSQHKDALRHFARLAVKHPEDHELQLRLAMAWLGDDKKRPAKASLRQLVEEEGAEDWIRILATQELARLLDREEARQLLEEAAGTYPKEAQLALQLAASLGEDWRRIDRLAAAIAPGPDARERPSARLLYDIPRRDEIDPARIALAERTEGLLPSLHAALLELGRQTPVKPRNSPCRLVAYTPP